MQKKKALMLNGYCVKPAGKRNVDYGFAFPISIAQTRSGFEVRYGKQVNRSLDYSQACSKLGQAVLHALCCDGRFDNREHPNADV